MTYNSFSKESLMEMYQSGRSMSEISKLLNCSEHKVVYWMNKFGFQRRSRSDAMYVKYNPIGDPFHIKTILTKDEYFLYGLGLGIYWGEGEKVSKNAVRVANTDPHVIKTFIKFLRLICMLEERKLTYSLVCFNDSNIMLVSQYWEEMLGISSEKFGKIVQIPPQGKGTYKRKSQFGVCTVSVSNIKLKAWIMEEINKLKTLPT